MIFFFPFEGVASFPFFIMGMGGGLLAEAIFVHVLPMLILKPWLGGLSALFGCVLLNEVYELKAGDKVVKVFFVLVAACGGFSPPI